jgi:hypothetical protein
VNARISIQLDEEPAINLPSVLPLTHVSDRCFRWGIYLRWLESVGMLECGPRPVKSWYGPLILNPHVAQQARDSREKCPVSEEECLETDQAIRRLPDRLKELMFMEHVIDRVPDGRGRWRTVSQQEKADRLGIHRQTYWRWCNEAYGQLLGHMNDISAGL